MATIYQVAELASVSLATVSRVINGNQNVSEKTRSKVQQAMASLNYRPNNVAQSLASNRSNSIGLLVPEVDGPFFGELMGGVEEVLRGAGKHLVITPGHFNVQQEEEGIDFLISRGCDALILAAEAVSDDYLIALQSRNVPFMIVGRSIEQLNSACISLDNIEGGYLATRLMLDSGHTEIGYIAGPIENVHTVHRLQGHQKALQSQQLELDESRIFYGDFKESGGVEGFKTLIGNHPNLTAVVCANDELAAGVNNIARKMGYRVPEDISLVGYDNDLFTRYMYPKLTTISNPIREMGAMAASKLLHDIYDLAETEITHLFRPTVINRESVVKS